MQLPGKCAHDKYIFFSIVLIISVTIITYLCLISACNRHDINDEIIDTEPPEVVITQPLDNDTLGILDYYDVVVVAIDNNEI